MGAPHADLFAVSSANAARDHVRNVVARSQTSFTWGMRILSRPRREAMHAIYAFCREVDDIADGPGDVTGKLSQLDEWRVEIERLYTGSPTVLTTLALARPVQAFNLPREEFHAIIDGMEMDARGDMLAPTMADFRIYCRRVAGAVGLLSIRAFGAAEPQAPALAITLGDALQITNILRDLHEDAQRGRLYLPRDLLEANGIRTRSPEAALAHPAVGEACAALARLAQERFAETRSLLQVCDRRRLKPAVLMMEVYERVLNRLQRRGWREIDRPVRVSRPEKLWIVGRHGLL